MGNTLGGPKSVKVMKIDGEVMKFKTPVEAREVLNKYPNGYVLLESEAVKHYGTRATPLGDNEKLNPRRLYFIVELSSTKCSNTRRVKSGINMSAKDRLESLMLARRSVSDLSVMKPTSITVDEQVSDVSLMSVTVDEQVGDVCHDELPARRMKMRVPKAEVEKVMMEGGSEAEVREKILRLCLARKEEDIANKSGSGVLRKANDGPRIVGAGFDPRVQKRVGFVAINEGEIQVA